MRPLQAEDLPAIVCPKQVQAFIPCSESWFYKQIRNNPNFPKLIKLSPKKTGIRKEDLITYVASL